MYLIDSTCFEKYEVIYSLHISSLYVCNVFIRTENISQKEKNAAHEFFLVHNYVCINFQSSEQKYIMRSRKYFVTEKI